jgi:glycosyltransferase involved in cell wall biosynthesis
MKGNILVLTNFIAGLHSFRKEVMKAIVDAGYQLYISVPDTNDERVNYFKGIGAEIIKTDFNRRGMNPLADFKLMMNYRRLIKQLKPIAVLSYTIKPNVYGGIACRLTGTPLIANVTGLGDAIENGGWLQKLTICLYKFGIGKAAKVFFQNETNKNFCVNHKIADNNAIVLPGSGVNLEHHRYQEYAPDGVIKFLFIARLLKDKGTSEYFETAKTIKAKYPQSEFQVLGWKEGPYQQQLEELVKDGVINYLGTTSDIRPYLTNVHCTIMPSYHEGMSNVNLESAANGRPVITTNVPGCRETVEDGKTGYLVDAKNSEALIKGVERFLDLPYKQKVAMGKMAREKVEREFDRNIVVKAYLNAIESFA